MAGRKAAPALAPVVRGLGWLWALGIALVLVGVVAIVHPLTATVVALAWLGALFAAAGLAQLLQAWTAAGWRGTSWHIASGAAYLLGGLVLLFDPFAGGLAVVWVLAATLIASGALRLSAGLALRPAPGWAWIALGGLVAAAAGAGLVLMPPGQSVLIPGLLVGVSFLCEGLLVVAFARAARRSLRGA